ncbi:MULTISPECIES: hypothetical protein [unclassified Cobetia]|uniref:hypothetical protein n=1 Tax=unclassified Cobetia TaxID=2609414 RepID=UPI002097658B|nr:MULTISPECIES: hypothetical protein [unclassified Cobetia]MCO7232891.1 hypothetical protein [Cobetia sp. Dlab-2-AX]MCO7236121.1 hypothetical protein [Cobetia sp. Dlab-2-U]
MTASFDREKEPWPPSGLKYDNTRHSGVKMAGVVEAHSAIARVNCGTITIQDTDLKSNYDITGA